MLLSIISLLLLKFISQISSLSHNEESIDYDYPDISATIENFNGYVQIDAYQSKKNIKIIENNQLTKYNQLSWVSFGSPTLIETLDKNNLASTENNNKLFHFSTNNFYFYVNMLTKKQKEALAKAATIKYKEEINETQFLHLPLSKFHCSFEIVDSNGLTHLYKGDVTNFKEYPLRVDFTDEIKKIDELNNRVKNDGFDLDLGINCEIASPNSELTRKILAIKPSQLNNFDLIYKIFGDSKSAIYVSKEQLEKISNEIFRSLKIEEEYDVKSSKFTKDFINLFENQNQLESIMLNYDDIKNDISNYPLHYKYNENLQSSDLAKLLVNILTTNNADTYEELKNQFEKIATSIGMPYKKTISFLTLEYQMNWLSLDFEERFNKLNENIKDEIEWKIIDVENQKIHIKSVKVYHLKRSYFSRKFIFKDISKIIVVHPFWKKFTLYTKKTQNNQPDFRIKEYIFKFDAKLNRTLKAFERPINFKPIVYTGISDIFDVNSNSQFRFSSRKLIKFPNKFKEIPTVQVSLSGIDMIPNIKLLCNIENISITGFEYVCSTFPIGKNIATSFQWLAVGYSP